MIGAGTFINPLLRIITTVVILGAVYLFLVKPILDTTNDTIDRAFQSAQPALNQLNQTQRQAQRQLHDAGIDQRRATAIANDAQQDADRLLGCIDRANGDAGRIAACGQKF
jgi:F0F1-type ATP synthase membrane subunit b/b'